MVNEYLLRIERLCEIMAGNNIDAGFFTANKNLFYLTGRVFDGYVYISAETPSKPVVFLRRPDTFVFDECFTVVKVRKPEQMADIMPEQAIKRPRCVALESDDIPYSEYKRLKCIFNDAEISDINVIRLAKTIKTPFEIEQIAFSAKKQCELYRQVPLLFKKRMTDAQLMAAIECHSKFEGNLGTMRAFGHRMELNYGSVLCGKNADAPSPFDFALGGAGLHPSQPVSVSGAEIEEGMSVMVDVASNHNGYLSDCTRTFSLGKLPGLAYEAHDVAMKIMRECEKTAKEGTLCSDLYNAAAGIAESAGMGSIFMGKTSQAKFIGHGVGIEINELPVIAPRFNTPLKAGMVIALEPKFVIEGAGAVGIENTYAVTQGGLLKLTDCEEKILPLDYLK